MGIMLYQACPGKGRSDAEFTQIMGVNCFEQNFVCIEALELSDWKYVVLNLLKFWSRIQNFKIKEMLVSRGVGQGASGIGGLGTEDI